MSPEDLHFLIDESISKHPDVINQINKAEELALPFQELFDSYTLPETKRERKFISFN